MQKLPLTIFSGDFHGCGHVQGIAVDAKREYVYYSFTTMLVKTDIHGNFIGSVTGIIGHLGCMAYCPYDGRIYCSLEYKDDCIGRGVLGISGSEKQPEIGFYIAVFDADKITRSNMSAETDGVMSAVYLTTVTQDYLAEGHRYGCSGIDGLSFGPEFGTRTGKTYLNVCYGIYSDTDRADNDCQVLLHYDAAGWKEYERPLTQDKMHKSGPASPDARYFVYTGNTDWGVQNLEYDPFSGDWLMAVYRGHKPQFPNRNMYFIDGSAAAEDRELPGYGGLRGKMLTLAKRGINHSSGIFGIDFEYGSTGIVSLGDGRFYFSENSDDGERHSTTLRLYRSTDGHPFFIPLSDQ